ncbi:unannotated protein [freshwater metagenome]|uniref:Unannotated protein n=1 Tax=freshwater metagenome TaxID=449393 RepID=A0A6J6HAI3_9ZZZZ
MQLAQAKSLGTINNQGVGIRNIDSGFDDRGRNQHIKTLFPEIDHHLLERRLAHLPMGNRDAGFGHELGQIGSTLVDGFDAVVHEKHLTLTN